MSAAVPDWLAAASRITVLTGAGISTDSGIPDFRGPQGVWTRDPEAEKLSTALLTQNIDGLHQAAGSDPGLVLELHGTVHAVSCPAPVQGPAASLRAVGGTGVLRPACGLCGGILTSATISFGQALDAAVIGAAAEAAADCDVLLAVGTSLTVHPAAGLVDLAASAGARVVVVNAEPTPYDATADLVVREPIGTALPRLLA